MNLRAYRTFQALILAGLGLFLLTKVIDGRILLYINQRFVLLVLGGALGLMLLAQVVLRERPPQDAVEPQNADHEHHHQEAWQPWGLFLLALPLLIGLLVPQRPLSTASLQTRGINTGASLSVQGGAAQALQLPASQRSLLDWIRVASEDPEGTSYNGQPADVTGFVYHDLRLGEDQFMVGRFTIACCVADASALGMVVAWPGAAELPDNRWVRVRGTVSPSQFDGRTVPLLTAQQVEFVPEPEQPYLFP